MRYPLSLLAAIMAASSLACGARSPLSAPEEVVEPPAADASAGGERACLPTCTIGHRCCIGGCDGPPAETPSDCCACLPGEVSSSACGGSCGEP